MSGGTIGGDGMGYIKDIYICVAYSGCLIPFFVIESQKCIQHKCPFYFISQLVKVQKYKCDPQ